MMKIKDWPQRPKASFTKGLTFLAKEQHTNGSFLSLSSPDPIHFQDPHVFPSVFSTALILECVTQLPASARTRAITNKAVQFLVSQKSEQWSFNYWDRNSPEFKQLPYPDDLDDTFCALASLHQADPKLVSGEALAAVVKLLTALEVQEGGPYRTWVVSDDAEPVWRDVDVVVNSNIAYFLSLQNISLPNLVTYLDDRIQAGQLTSPYYPDLMPIIYFMSRGYQGNLASSLVKQVLALQVEDGAWATPLQTALAVLALHNLGAEVLDHQASVASLIATQTKAGYWPPAPFYTGVNPTHNQRYYAGSKALTTAFCVQALARLMSPSSAVVIEPTPEAKQLYIRIHRSIQNELKRLPTPLKTATQKSLTHTLQADNKAQVALLPYYFHQALGAPTRSLPNLDSLLTQLGKASVYGWLAYTIYDDFLDHEGQVVDLPSANYFLRQLTTLFTQAVPTPEFSAVFHHTMDQLESANTWEVTHCRVPLRNQRLQLANFTLPNFGDLGQLADRSLGHTLAPLAVLHASGLADDPTEVKHILTFFRHYLIARQLNDDAHDWEADLKLGQVNAVGCLVLKKARVRRALSLTQIAPQLQPVFWNTVIVEVCHLIFHHLGQAKQALHASKLITQPAILENLLTKYEVAAHEALREREKTLEFLAAY